MTVWKFDAVKLCAAMTAAGMTDSDLARAVWGDGPRGAKNRDRIRYFRKGGGARPETFVKIAEALGVSVDALRAASPAMPIKSSHEGPTRITVPIPGGSVEITVRVIRSR